MSFTSANILILTIIICCLILIRFDILKQVMLAMFLTGIVQCLISGYMDLMIIALMLGIFRVVTTVNKLD